MVPSYPKDIERVHEILILMVYAGSEDSVESVQMYSLAIAFTTCKGERKMKPKAKRYASSPT